MVHSKHVVSDAYVIL